MKFKELVLATVGFVLEYHQPLGRALLIPFLLSIFLELLVSNIPGGVLSIFLFLAQLIVQVLIAVTTHRILLLGPKAVPTWGILRWSRRESQFACYGIGLTILATFSMILVSFIASFVAIIGQLVVLLSFVLIFVIIAPRLSLVFPAIAIDKKMSFSESWQLTANWQGLMFFAVILFPTMFAIPIVLINTIPFTTVISAVLTSCLTVFGVAALSVSYKVISINGE